MEYTNCLCCGTELQPDEIFTPCYDDGGGLDSFDVQLKWPSYPYCEGCDDYIPQEAKDLNWYTSYKPDEDDDDELPF